MSPAATITSLNAPGASFGNVNANVLSAQLGNLGLMTTQNLYAQYANIPTLAVGNFAVGQIMAQYANISTLNAQLGNVTVMSTQNLYAQNANIPTLAIGNLTALYANISTLNAQLGNVTVTTTQNLYAQYANIPTLTVGSLTGGGGGTLTVGQILAQNLTANVSSLGNVQGPLTVSGDIIFTGNLRQTLFSNSGATGPLNYTFGNLAAANLVTTNANIGILGAGAIFCSNIVGYSPGAGASQANIPANLSLVSLQANALLVQGNTTLVQPNGNVGLTINAAVGVGGGSAGVGISTYQGRAAPSVTVTALDDGNYAGHMLLSTAPTGSATTAPQERFRITPAGFVGINQATPTYQLDVGGSIRSNAFTADGTGVILSAPVSLTGKAIFVSAASDPNHRIVYDATVDGPSIYGYGGGRLASSNGNVPALTWTNQGINIPTTARANALIVQNSSSTLVTTANGFSINCDQPIINLLPNNRYAAVVAGYAGRQAGPYAAYAFLDDNNYSSHLTLNTATPGNPNNSVSERLRVTSAGLVGIGITNPNSALDVAGNIRATTTTSTYSTALRLESTTTAAVGATLDMASQYTSISQPNKICARQWAEADNLSGGRWVLQTSNTGGTLITGASLNAAGNFGLGSVTAGGALYPLDVGGSCRVQGQYIVGNVSDTAGVNASIVQRVQNTSVVLAPQPTAATSSNGSCSNYHYTDYNYPNQPGGQPGGRCFVMDSNYGTDFRWQSKTPGAATNALIERFTITSGGNVGINTPVPTAMLDVGGPVRVANALRFVNTNTTLIPGPGGTSQNDYLQINGYTGTGVVVGSSSMVGVGTISPAYQLDVAGNTRVTGNFTVATSPAITYMLRGVVSVPVNPTLTSQGDYQVSITYGQNLPDLNYIITATIVSTNNYSDWYTASITNKSINGATCNMARLTNVGGSGANVATTTWGDGGLQVNWIVMR